MHRKVLRLGAFSLMFAAATAAHANKMPAKKLVQELEKQNRLPEIYQQIVHEKVLDFLQNNAKIEDVSAA